MAKRWQLASLAVIQALDRARDDQGKQLFPVKGGVALAAEFGDAARPTTDLDVNFRARMLDLQGLLRNALTDDWEGFGFRIARGPEPIADTGSMRCDVKVSYVGSALCTVKLEIGSAEGVSGQVVRLTKNNLIDPSDIGLPPVDSVAIVAPEYAIAQKLHACTDHSNTAKTNDRSRDLRDIITLWRTLDRATQANVKKACLEVFEGRGRQTWPPTVEVVDGWEGDYAALVSESDFEPADVHEAAAAVNEIITKIDHS